MTKLTVAFRNFMNVSNNGSHKQFTLHTEFFIPVL